ncbi:MAG: carboxypeptidase M32 [Nannocystaceae bacterium]
MRSTTEGDLQELRRRLAELDALEGVLGILSWDQEVMMPRGAGEARGRQVAAVALVHHQRLCDPVLGRLLEGLAATEGLAAVDAANVREALRDQRRALRIPAALVERWSEVTVRAHAIWTDARARADFAGFAPILGELVDLARQRAAAIDPDRPTYEVLLDEFEPGTTIAALDRLFAALRGRLRPLIAELRGREAPPVPAALRAQVAADRQEAVGRELMAALGFDFSRGRLDRAVHPFCGGAGVDDVRVTSRYAEGDLLSGLLAIIHETGHALYEQGRDPAYADQPVSRARSMGWHESQSLLWENQVGRSPEFWRFLLPWLGERLPAYRDADHGAIVRALARVDFTNTIRVEADELTYPLHVILRYEIERGLFADSAADRLRVDELPALWDARTLDYLGVARTDDARGILQDVHWSGGAFGYFPSYTIGAVLAAQLFAAAEAALPGLRDGLARGEAAPLRAWLGEHVHRQGSRLESDALARAVTGEGLRPEPFLDYVEAKFRAAYAAP